MLVRHHVEDAQAKQAAAHRGLRPRNDRVSQTLGRNSAGASFTYLA
jgi:hypothetical protein